MSYESLHLCHNSFRTYAHFTNSWRLGVLAVRQIKLLGDFCVSPIFVFNFSLLISKFVTTSLYRSREFFCRDATATTH